MRKPKCPVCKREVPKVYIRRGTFACPSCGSLLRVPQLKKSHFVPIVLAGGLSAAILIPYLLGLRQNALLVAAIVLFAPCAIGTGFLSGAALALLFPRLERDYGIQEGEFLHVTPRRDPRKG